MNSVLCWSGGKDSTASIILAHDNGIRIDKIIMSEVMFSHELNISGEDSEHINWVYNIAIPKIESWGYKVIVLRDKEDYLSLFNRKYIQNIKNPKKNDKKWGFPLNGLCYCNNYLKMRPINQFKKQFCNNETIEYVGIAIDEKERLQNIKIRNKNAVSLLEQFDHTEQMAFNLCVERDLLSPIYLRHVNRRQGCWFCPNRSIAQFAELRRREPEKWNMLVELSKTPNLCSYGFKWGDTVQEVENQIDLYELQEFWKSKQMAFNFNEVAQ